MAAKTPELDIRELQGRNKIINGDMLIDQRNAGAAVTPAAASSYTIDRFTYTGTQASKMTLQQVSDAPVGFKYSHRLTVASSATPAASDQFRYGQSIEGFNIADLGWGTSNAQVIAVSFWAKTSIAGTYSVAIWNVANGRSYVTTVVLTSSWAKYSITIAGDITGTWATGNTAGLELIFDLGASTDYTTSTTNTWLALNKFKASGSVSLVSNAAATFNITGVQLEKGAVATEFEHQSYSRKLIDCQRYYELLVIPPNSYHAQYNSSGGNFFGHPVMFATTKRANPTCSLRDIIPNFYWVIAQQSAYSANDSTGAAFDANITMVRMRQSRIVGGNTPTSGSVYIMEAGFTILADAEL